MSEMKFDVAGVLAAHTQRNGGPCGCGYHPQGVPGWHPTHLATAIRTHIVEKLRSSEARLAVTRAVADIGDSDSFHAQVAIAHAAPTADAALAAVGDLLGVEVGR